MACIILNTLVLTMSFYEEPSALSKATEILNYIFAVIFTLEAIIKIIGLGKSYFKEKWNVFDFVIVVGTFAGIMVSSLSQVAVGPQATVMRSFRIFRIFRIIKRAKSLNLMFNTFLVSLPAMQNVGFLLVIFLYIYSILGIFLFSEVKLSYPLHDYLNFQSFHSAFLLLLRASTGEGWHEILHSLTKSPSILYPCI